MRGSSRGLAWTLVGLAVLNSRESVAAPVEGIPVQVQLGARAGLDADDVGLVEQTAGSLLATGGIKVYWRTCASADPCPVVALVHALAQWKMADRDVSGEVVHDARTDHPIVLVYLNRIREVTRRMQSGPIGRWHPALATLDVGHLVGLTIAHELGHALGLPHAANGVMKAKPSIDEVVALRQSRLAFSAPERARMLAVVAALHVQVSDTNVRRDDRSTGRLARDGASQPLAGMLPKTNQVEECAAHRLAGRHVGPQRRRTLCCDVSNRRETVGPRMRWSRQRSES